MPELEEVLYASTFSTVEHKNRASKMLKLAEMDVNAAVVAMEVAARNEVGIEKLQGQL